MMSAKENCLLHFFWVEINRFNGFLRIKVQILNLIFLRWEIILEKSLLETDSKLTIRNSKRRFHDPDGTRPLRKPISQKITIINRIIPQIWLKITESGIKKKNRMANEWVYTADKKYLVVDISIINHPINYDQT